MRLALLSDIHANVQALDACLAHARAQQVQGYIFLGDLVGYGADPAAVLDRVMDMASAGAPVIQGNHDAMAVQPPAQVTTVGASTAAWTHQQLSANQRAWLAQLPLTFRRDDMLLVHASAHEPQAWNYIYDADAAEACLQAATARDAQVQYVFCGHVHLQSLYYGALGLGLGLSRFTPQAGLPLPLQTAGPCVCTIGAVGQPRDGNPSAMYAVFDTERRQLCFQRVAYDHFSAAAAIYRAGLPGFFSARLLKGR